MKGTRVAHWRAVGDESGKFLMHCRVQPVQKWRVILKVSDGAVIDIREIFSSGRTHISKMHESALAAIHELTSGDAIVSAEMEFYIGR